MSERTGHLTSEILQDYLEGVLAADRHPEVEAHLGECPRCAAELEGWSLLFQELEELPELGPSRDFQERVLARLPGRTPARESLWDRLRALVTTTGRAASEHLSPGGIQDLLDGALTGRSRRRVRAHLAACQDCRAEAESWKMVFRSLEELPRLAPSPGFAQRVMAAVELGEARAAVPARAPAGAWLLENLRAAARSLVPSTRKGWALAGGALAAPAVGMLAAVGAVAAHPLLTLGDLAAFLWWRAGDAVGFVGSWAVAQVVESPLLPQAYQMAEALVASPGVAAGGLLVLWAVTLGAGIVLYRNVIAPSFMAERHVR